ncbi:protein of unknown function (plasmid) [Cupriavidus taiwanensis]|uniref:Uncharacterized protein n=1 Tax=Cupriavidus taiwanensis TaxID=164546 RepID=A0A7Z7JCY8_9BURK|nr:protein of unknown function [Cupriavidus taiwanensis]SOZ10885.1 protein of unknown function [Cupriavidus taiwanensis]SOZ42137.1 protein of unknown function [Cupriavidus taiwanensis]SPC21247.1 protein of unknown function [Cupriavidus taiwanensis]SPD55388.1 protein of unknown function [Cupriavidus taiwanensis]
MAHGGQETQFGGAGLVGELARPRQLAVRLAFFRDVMDRAQQCVLAFEAGTAADHQHVARGAGARRHPDFQPHGRLATLRQHRIEPRPALRAGIQRQPLRRQRVLGPHMRVGGTHHPQTHRRGLHHGPVEALAVLDAFGVALHRHQDPVTDHARALQHRGDAKPVEQQRRRQRQSVVRQRLRQRIGVGRAPALAGRDAADHQAALLEPVAHAMLASGQLTRDPLAQGMWQQPAGIAALEQQLAAFIEEYGALAGHRLACRSGPRHAAPAHQRANGNGRRGIAEQRSGGVANGKEAAEHGLLPADVRIGSGPQRRAGRRRGRCLAGPARQRLGPVADGIGNQRTAQRQRRRQRRGHQRLAAVRHQKHRAHALRRRTPVRALEDGKADHVRHRRGPLGAGHRRAAHQRRGIDQSGCIDCARTARGHGHQRGFQLGRRPVAAHQPVLGAGDLGHAPDKVLVGRLGREHGAKVLARGPCLLPYHALEPAMQKQGKTAADHHDEQGGDNGEKATGKLPVCARQPIGHWRSSSSATCLTPLGAGVCRHPLASEFAYGLCINIPLFPALSRTAAGWDASGQFAALRQRAAATHTASSTVNALAGCDALGGSA